MADSEIFLSAGEISGDRYGGEILEALHRLQPELRAFGIGGERLTAAGLEKVAGIESFSLVGITEVLPRLASLLRLLTQVKKLLTRRRPRAVILIDSPEFNFRLAVHARSLGLKVIYYVGPSLWAWRRGRIRTMRRCVDLMLAILPFEEALYRTHGIRVEYVGHPLIDHCRPEMPTEEFLASLGLRSTRPTIAFLPGSRRSEVRAHLPALLEAGTILSQRSPTPNFLFPAASREMLEMMRGAVEKILPGSRLVMGRACDCLAAAQAAVVASGTATLEAALMGTPFVTIYRLSPLSYLAGRILVKIPHITLPNILMREKVVEELIQRDCRSGKIAAEVAPLLDDPEVAFRMREKFAIIRNMLGRGGAADRAASAVMNEIGGEPSVTPRRR
jgi:lipid-A-disaccharide synthase